MSSTYDPENFTPGEMDITDHHAAFAGFMKSVIIVTGIVIAVLVFLLIVAV